MDRKLKERLVGATLLVVAAVVFIPWVLDGAGDAVTVSEPLALPAPEGLRRERVELQPPERPGSAEQRTGTSLPEPANSRPPPSEPAASQPATDSAAASREPNPAAATPARTEVRKPESEPVRAASTPGVVKPPASAPSTSSGSLPAAALTAPGTAWAVQVGSFQVQSNARSLTQKLEGMNYAAFMSRDVVNGQVNYRVRVGPVTSRDEAVVLGERLRGDGQDTAVVRHP